MKKVALKTGESTGIGREFGQIHAENGRRFSYCSQEKR